MLTNFGRLVRWFPVGMAIASLIVAPGPALAADTSVGVIVDLTGAAEVRTEETWQPISVGSSVLVGSSLRTGPAGLMRAVFYDGSSLSFERSTEVVIEAHSYDADSGRFQARIRLLRGQVRPTAQVQDGKQAQFEIASDSARAHAESADFVVEYDEPSGSTKVTSIRGQVAIHSTLDPTTAEVLITARQVTSVKRGEVPAPPAAAERFSFSQAGNEDGVLGSTLPEAAIWSQLLGPVVSPHEATAAVLNQRPLSGGAENRRANSVSDGNDVSSLTGRPTFLPGQLDLGVIIGNR